MGFFNKSIISIDLGSYETKIVQGIKTKDEIKAEKAFSFITPMGSYNDGNINNYPMLAADLKNELRENKVITKHCRLCINSTGIITRELPFPMLSSKEIEGLLRYQLEEYLPMDYNKYAIQHRPLGNIVEDGMEKINVLVVAIPKDMVEMHYGLVRELGLRPMVLDYQSNCIWKLLRFTNAINDETDPSKKTIAAVDLGYSSTNVSVFKKGKLQTSKAIDIGGQSLDNNVISLLAVSAEEVHSRKSEIPDINEVEEEFSDNERYVNIIRTSLESIIDRVDRVLKYYLSKDMDNEIDKIILYGGLSNINGIEQLFVSNFGIPTQILKSINKVSLNGDVNKYINCLGALLRDDEV